MSKSSPSVPVDSYGVRAENKVAQPFDFQVESLFCNGFAVVDSGKSELTTRCAKALSDDDVRVGADGVVRAPRRFENPVWRALALNENFLRFVGRILNTHFCLLQQNAVTVDPDSPSSQARWHRDFPYQSFVPSRPFILNCLFAIDEFTLDNGATWVLPGAHRFEELPSTQFVSAKAVQVQVPAGSFVVLDGFLFHSAGHNRSRSTRRAVNHVFGPPLLRPQLEVVPSESSDEFDRLLGKEYFANNAVMRWLESGAGES